MTEHEQPKQPGASPAPDEKPTLPADFDDPKTLRARWEAQLRKRLGEEWLETNRASLDAQWEYIQDAFL